MPYARVYIEKKWIFLQKTGAVGEYWEDSITVDSGGLDPDSLGSSGADENVSRQKFVAIQ